MKKLFLLLVLGSIAGSIWFYSKNKKLVENFAADPAASLSFQLENIMDLDQKYRKQWDSVSAAYGGNSDKAKTLYKLITRNDSSNLLKVSSILDSIGLPGAESVGPNGYNAIFLVIQHAGQSTQEKYLPMFRKAVKNNLLPKSNLALLEDRILLGQGKKQIYGSQIGYDVKNKKNYLRPLENPDSVDARRFEAELGPIKDYLQRFDIVWDLKQYKKDLPSIEKLEKYDIND